MASFITMQAIINAVETDIYQSSGPGVQLYSQDIIQQKVQDAFDHVFEMHWWPRFVVGYGVTLDGVTGQSVETPAYITDYRDIRYVYYETDTVPIPKLPLDYNVGRFTSQQAGRPQFIEMADNAKLFRVWPNQSVGSLAIRGRNRPAPFQLTEVVPFDPLIIRHFAAWSYYTDDGSSPASAAKHQGLFESRLKRLEDTEFNQPLSLNTNAGTIPDRWSESFR